jgi:hypothetical protein
MQFLIPEGELSVEVDMNQWIQNLPYYFLYDEIL